MGIKNSLEVRADAVANLGVSERGEFIAKTYAHLAGAVFAYVLVMVMIIQLTPTAVLESVILTATGGWAWLVVLGIYVVVSMVARKWATSDTSVGMQYMGLGLYIVAMAVISIPMVYVAAHYSTPDVLPMAGGTTLAMFAGLTAIVFVTRKDFSFLKGILGVGMMVAIGCIVCGVIFGFSLGLFFTVAMIGLMCGYILYDTSNVLHHYRPGQHVAASLSLFASLATLFWYVLSFFMSRD